MYDTLGFIDTAITDTEVRTMTILRPIHPRAMPILIDGHNYITNDEGFTPFFAALYLTLVVTTSP